MFCLVLYVDIYMVGTKVIMGNNASALTLIKTVTLKCTGNNYIHHHHALIEKVNFT